MGKLVHFRPNDLAPLEVNGLPFNYTMKYQLVNWCKLDIYIITYMNTTHTNLQVDISLYSLMGEYLLQVEPNR